MLPALGFGLHVATTHGYNTQLLTAEMAFPALTLFQIVSSGIQEASAHIMGLLVAFGSLQRVDEFLALESWQDSRILLKGASSSETSTEDANKLSEKGNGDMAVRLEGVSARWATEAELIITDATFEVPSQGLTMIAGAGGCGKSTLLRVILGDITPSSGTVSIRNRFTGFCDQTPWVSNVSVRENIVGAFSFDKEHYNFALKTCAIDRDLQDLAEGDEHVCGLNGASLSGGQRVRLVSDTGPWGLNSGPRQWTSSSISLIVYRPLLVPSIQRSTF